jgi:hypothetical protein
MPTDPTPERVREIAGWDAGKCIQPELVALARQVIALREALAEAKRIGEEVRKAIGCACDPCEAETYALLARLDAMGGG